MRRPTRSKASPEPEFGMTRVRRILGGEEKMEGDRHDDHKSNARNTVLCPGDGASSVFYL
jgi:hypothetical protein